MNPHFHHAISLNNDLGIAAEAVRLGGEAIRNYWRRLSAEEIREKSKGDLVTEADLTSERIIAEFLRREMPDAAVIAEEGTALPGDSLVWFVDPLDGTTNFVQQFPVFCVSVALVERANTSVPTILAAAVYDPVGEQLFTAAPGRGSYRNSERLRVSKKECFSDAMIATGFPRRYHDELSGYLKEFAAIFPDCRAIRRAGSAALDLCWTAQGIFDGFWEHKLSPWDIAAGVLIVEEAGGICSDFEGSRNFLKSGNIIGAASVIHAGILERIRRARET